MAKAIWITLGFLVLMMIVVAVSMMHQDTETMSEKIYYESRGAEGYVPRHWMGKMGEGI